MKSKILSIFTRTPLHVGCGSSVGAVDQPVVRERHTGYPVIPGSTLKGALADLWTKGDGNVQGGNTPQGTPDTSNSEALSAEGNGKDRSFARNEDALELFGNDPADKTAQSGSLLIGEGKLLAFPVRSAKGGYAFITCPQVLNRFKRDCPDFKASVEFNLSDEKVLLTTKSELSFGAKVVFESYAIDAESRGDVDNIADTLLNAMPEDPVWGSIIKRLAIVSDGVFKHFVEGTCEIAQHNRINDLTGVVDDKALFCQENVPSETMFYSVFGELKSRLVRKVEDKLKSEEVGNVLQIGADMTTGLGWCSVAFYGKKEEQNG